MGREGERGLSTCGRAGSGSRVESCGGSHHTSLSTVLKTRTKMCAFPTMVRRARVTHIASLRRGTQSQGSGGIREGSQGSPGEKEALPGRTGLPLRNFPHVSLAARKSSSSTYVDGAACGCRRAGGPPGLPSQQDNRRTEGMKCRGGRAAADNVRSQESDQPAVRRGPPPAPSRQGVVPVRAVDEVEGRSHVHQPDRVRDPLADHHRPVSIVPGAAGSAVGARHEVGTSPGGSSSRVTLRPKGER